MKTLCPTPRHRAPSASQFSALMALVSMLAGMLMAAPAQPAFAVQSPTVCSSTVALANGGFEAPVLGQSATQLRPSTALAWSTTATDRNIEVWSKGYRGVTSGSGTQHAELNATQSSMLYQDRPTTPGQTLRWELQHRGREGVDTMAVQIGPPTGPLLTQRMITDGKLAWGTHAGVYTVPAGQTTTRFGFTAISTATGDLSVGNFLDSIAFGTGACIVASAAVTTAAGTPAATANVGDVLTYTATAANGGGNPAEASVLTDVLPAGVSYVAGSMTATTGSVTTAVSDAAGDDPAEYVAGTRTVRARLGTGATAVAGGSILPGEARKVSFKVRVEIAAALTTLTGEASTTYSDALSTTSLTSTSNATSTSIGPAADLSVSAVLRSPAVAAGSPAGYDVTVTNTGPQTAPSTRLVATAPAGLSALSATTSGGSCTTSGSVITCDYGTLAVGDARTVTLTGNVAATTTPGAQYSLSATASTARHDPAPANNTASVSTAVTVAANLRVLLAIAPSAPIAGADATYTATITNQGPSLARGIVLSDPIVSGSTFVSATTPGGSCTLTGTNTVECSVPDLAPGASAPVTIVLRLSPGGTGSVNNAVSVTATTPDPDATDNNDSLQSAGSAMADLGVQLTIAGGATTARPGETHPFTLTVTNHGPSVATNVSFVTSVPRGFTVVRPANPYCTVNACTFPGLAPGQIVPITGTVMISPDVAAGPGRASSTVISPTADGNPANDISTVNFTVLLDSDLALTHTIANPDASGDAVAGGRVQSRMTVTNSGPTRAEGIVVQQVIPAGAPVPTATAGAGTCTVHGAVTAGNVSAAGGSYVCTLGVLAAAASWDIVLETPLAPGTTEATFTRTATLTATSPDSSAANDTATASIAVARPADLAVTQTTSTPSVHPYDTVRLTIGVMNAGPAEARNVLVRARAQTGMVLTSASTTVGSWTAADGGWQIPDLAVGATASLDVVGAAEGPGTATAVAELVSLDGRDPDAANDTATTAINVTTPIAVPVPVPLPGPGPVSNPVPVTGPVPSPVGVPTPVAAAEPRLAISTTATTSPMAGLSRPVGSAGARLLSKSPTRLGDAVRYSYRVRNPGNVTMSQLVVTDLMVGAVTCPEASLPAGADMTCTADRPYLVKQDDVDRQADIVTSATVSGRPPSSLLSLTYGPASDPVPVVAAAPALDSVQVAQGRDVDGNGRLGAGDTIVWTVTVTNTGNVTLVALQIAGLPGSVPCGSTTLAPGARTVCTSTPYAVTRGDAANGRLLATATVSSTGLQDQRVTDSTATTTSLSRSTSAAGTVVRPPATAAQSTAVQKKAAPPDSVLARTGADVGPLLNASTLLVLSGVGALVAARRRPRRPAPRHRAVRGSVSSQWG